MKPLHFVCCTLGPKEASAAHTSLRRLGAESVQLFEHDTAGPARRYNEVLEARQGRDEIIVLVRDDAMLGDVFLADKINAAIDRNGFSVVGVAGASSIEIAPAGRPTTWLQQQWPANSGVVEDVLPDGRRICTSFGPTPQRCIALDSVLLALDARRIGRLRFDERLTSEFLALDFCLAGDRAGLMVGTTNVLVGRASAGVTSGAAFEAAQATFREKWAAQGVARRSVGPETITLESPAVRAAFEEGPLARWIVPLLELPEFLPTSTLAWLGHIPFLSLLIELLRPRTCVELGVDLGASFLATCTFTERLGVETQCSGIDTWQGDHQAGLVDGDVIHAALSSYVAGRFRHARLLRKRFDAALPSFADGSVDLLHIDGLHTYEAVSDDFHTWLPKLSERGVILFHDTAVHALDFGVWRLWDEIRTSYRSFAFEHSAGLGVLAVGSKVPGALVELLDYVHVSSANADLVRTLCTVLGANIQHRFARRNQCLPGDELAATDGLVRDKSRHYTSGPRRER